MKYLIEAYSGRILSVLLGEDGRAVEIHADSKTDGLKLGDICIGRVERVAANTGACFVEVARGIKGYLPLDDLAAPRYTRKGSSPKVQQGDELIVQVSREAFGTKGMSLTTKLQLSGRYLLLEMSGTGLGISRKIQEERRRALREHLFSEQTLEEMRQQLGSCGVIVRTNAEHAPDEDIRKELQNLTGAIHQLLLTAPYRPAYTVLLRQPDRWLKRIESVQAEKLEEILTDDRNLYEALEDYLPPYLKEKLRFYQDPMISMHNAFSLTRELSRALCRKVNMKSGANLVIEQTEALVSIDVNSAHSINGRDKEKAVLKVNMEAAEECARQIRLRNLSGMILVDFINMEEKESYDQLMRHLAQSTAQDPMQVKVEDLTALGLVEMTRKKVEVPLFRQLNGHRERSENAEFLP
ncbi:ribonuclease E/G [Porcincola intestinalis]|uniref:ribonuclease E/G n=1 Tax=Porcincola intestinalis TaxID=2606632 RepID=UPI002A90F720|nr:ribonuclease E/G [Porcincola intestinalis]MDY5578749.1 ribonuclease E/G [Porcincola intestinalis]